MASLIVKEDASAITSVFQPIVVSYGWEFPGCTVFDSSGALGIEVDITFLTDVPNGEFVQVLNGNYKGSYQVVSTTSDADSVFIVTDGTWSGADANSNLFNIDKKQEFELFAGYQSGNGSGVKPYQKIADIAVAINPNTADFEVDLQAYLRTYFEINQPAQGVDYGLSLQWELISSSGTVVSASVVNWNVDVQSAGNIVFSVIVDGTQEVIQFTTSNGTLNLLSGQTVQITASQKFITAARDATLTVTNTTTSSVVYQDTKTFIGSDGTTLSYAFTIAIDTDYSIDLTVL